MSWRPLRRRSKRPSSSSRRMTVMYVVYARGGSALEWNRSCWRLTKGCRSRQPPAGVDRHEAQPFRRHLAVLEADRCRHGWVRHLARAERGRARRVPRMADGAFALARDRLRRLLRGARPRGAGRLRLPAAPDPGPSGDRVARPRRDRRALPTKPFLYFTL